MTRAWRLVAWERRGEALDGSGAKKHPGAWNPRGVAAVYLTESRSQAILEAVLRLGSAARGPEFALIPVDLPSGMKVAISDADWLASAKAPLLRAPSRLIPGESLLVLNPAHPQAHLARAGTAERFRLS